MSSDLAHAESAMILVVKYTPNEAKEARVLLHDKFPSGLWLRSNDFQPHLLQLIVSGSIQAGWSLKAPSSINDRNQQLLESHLKQVYQVCQQATAVSLVLLFVMCHRECKTAFPDSTFRKNCICLQISELA